VDDAENRRVRPDAETEHEHGDDREARIFDQHARGEAQVLPERIHDRATAVLNECDARPLAAAGLTC
jgi:hypothetical protein